MNKGGEDLMPMGESEVWAVWGGTDRIEHKRGQLNPCAGLLYGGGWCFTSGNAADFLLFQCDSKKLVHFNAPFTNDRTYLINWFRTNETFFNIDEKGT